jgi:hypothetical protein
MASDDNERQYCKYSTTRLLPIRPIEKRVGIAGFIGSPGLKLRRYYEEFEPPELSEVDGWVGACSTTTILQLLVVAVLARESR